MQPDGSFTKTGGTPPTALLLVDMDGDGIADLVGVAGNIIEVWKGDGSGDFSSATPVFQFTLPVVPQLINIRDMDRDGIPDIVTPGLILYGKGKMAFDPVNLPESNDSFAVGDFNGDGKTDIATPAGIMLGMGNRQFSSPTGSVFSFADGPWAVADINGDGKDDIIFANESVVGTALGATDGIFLDQLLNLGDAVDFVEVADINGDGLPDILVGAGIAKDAAILFNDGKGGFMISSLSLGVTPNGEVLVDMNGDGKPDLVVQNFFVPPDLVVVLHK